MSDLVTVITATGYLGLFTVVFAESGLFFGFFLPGDSLLFTVGLLASQEVFDILLIVVFLSIAAVTGDSVGYAFGRRIGPKLFSRPESRFFKPSHVIRANEFFMDHGKKSIFLARFLPIVRTFVPIVAGVAGMPYRDFLLFNVVGGISWVVSMTLFGYVLGSYIPNAETYLYRAVALIIIVSFLPVLFHARGSRPKK